MSNIGSNAAAAATGSPHAAWPAPGNVSALRGQAFHQFAPAPRNLDIRIPVRALDDIVKARRAGRRLSEQAGCSGSRVALIMTAISELARNIIMHAGNGEIVLARSDNARGQGIRVTATDQGPGIADVRALFERPGTGAACTGLGLSGLKLVMDEFEIDSHPGEGTRVTCEVVTG